MPNERLIGIQQVVKRLDVSPRTVWRLVRRKLLPRPCYVDGTREAKWFVSDVEVYLGLLRQDEGRKQPPPRKPRKPKPTQNTERNSR